MGYRALGTSPDLMYQSKDSTHVYVAIEGVKGVGKSAILRQILPRLQNWTDSNNHTLAHFCPTQPMPESDALESLYVTYEQCDAFRQIIYAARSNYHASRCNWNDDLIISDRSIITSLAVRWHQAMRMGWSAERYYLMVRQYEHVIYLPDVVIYLEADTDTLLSRYRNRQRTYGNHEENENGIRQLKQNYSAVYGWLMSNNYLSDHRMMWVRIDCSTLSLSGASDRIFHEILGQFTCKKGEIV